jgi:hypothetical protein
MISLDTIMEPPGTEFWAELEERLNATHDGARLAESGAAGVSRSPDTRDAMAPDRWQHIQDVLADAIDCPASQRLALLDARYADDPSLRREVESLLIAHEGEGVVDRLGALVKPPGAWIREPVTEWSDAGSLITSCKTVSAPGAWPSSIERETSGSDVRSP